MLFVFIVPSAQIRENRDQPTSEGDVVQPRHTTPTSPNGQMTRSRVKALHDKVTSLLSMCDLDTPLKGLLLHSDTLCILRNHLDDDPQWSGGDEQEKVQDDGEDDQEKTQEDDQGEDEEGGGASLAGL